MLGWNKMLDTKQESLSAQSEKSIIVQPIRAQYLCLTIDCLDQSKISNGVVPREIDWAGINWTFYMAGIKNENNDTGSRIMETGNGILSDQSEISNVVILNHKAKLFSFSTTVH